MIKRLFQLFLVILIDLNAFGQDKDFGLWYNINAELSLSKKAEMDLSGSVRTFENASRMEEGYGEMGITFKVIKNLSIGGSYRFTDRLEDDGQYHPRHKWIADIKGNGDLGQFQFTGRLRFQRQDKTYFEDADDEIPDYYLRVKLKTTYKTRSFPVNPNVSLETFSRILEAADKTIEKYRLAIGAEYKFNKNHSAEIAYMFQKDYLPRLAKMNIIVLGYNFKF